MSKSDFDQLNLIHFRMVKVSDHFDQSVWLNYLFDYV